LNCRMATQLFTNKDAFKTHQLIPKVNISGLQGLARSSQPPPLRHSRLLGRRLHHCRCASLQVRLVAARAVHLVGLPFRPRFVGEAQPMKAAGAGGSTGAPNESAA
jgi:hypothetical protein